MRLTRDSAVRRDSIDPRDSERPSLEVHARAGRYTRPDGTKAMGGEAGRGGADDVRSKGRPFDAEDSDESRRERELDHALIRRAQAGEEFAFS